jgi:hypothetical protein
MCILRAHLYLSTKDARDAHVHRTGDGDSGIPELSTDCSRTMRRAATCPRRHGSCARPIEKEGESPASGARLRSNDSADTARSPRCLPRRYVFSMAMDTPCALPSDGVSAVAGDADLPAHLQHWTGRALRPLPRADVLAEWHQQGMANVNWISRGSSRQARPGRDDPSDGMPGS